MTRDYFPTIGARLREGRFFEVSDRRSDAPVAIVNETFANRNFPGRSPLGARFKFGQLGEKGYWYTIVGVVKEIREVGVMEEAEARGLSPARTGATRSGEPAERHRGSHGGRAGVDCLGGPSGDLVRR